MIAGACSGRCQSSAQIGRRGDYGVRGPLFFRELESHRESRICSTWRTSEDTVQN